MAQTRQSIGIVGAGAFGTALACVLADGEVPVKLYGRDPDVMARMAESRINPRLPSVTLPGGVEPVPDEATLSGHDTVLFAVPSSAQAETASRLAPHLAKDAAVVMCAKGLDRETGHTITDALADRLPGNRLAVLSGPGFAADIAAGLPTAMTLAARMQEDADRIAARLSRKAFRLYASDDMVGVQLGGALKNVLAIASGIVIGAGLGESARAALIARGLAEMTRFVVANGGRPETAAGLSGLGDLVLTATSAQSRNYRFGLAVGGGQSPAELAGEGQPLVEGAGAAITAARAAAALHVPMPVTDAVAAVVTGKADVATVVDRLLSRPLRSETA
ncbi:MAG: glycerol-3-phosphate dehydrogenase [Rhizobiales bacterium]|nr:glycerol-3-phosphate dehydrogenase [Hyphomicrobiales bacterium]MBA70918.1 glycerol-3-phosphate dehydrogenase [Hyphomicrobiales bacterium]